MKQFDIWQKKHTYILIRGTLVCTNLELLFSRALRGNVKNIWFSSSLEWNGNLEMSKFHQEQMSWVSASADKWVLLQDNDVEIKMKSLDHFQPPEAFILDQLLV